jgi:hypothetical protein
METYIKYKRIEKQVSVEELQKLFDELIEGGWQIIYYKEKGESASMLSTLSVVIVAGKTGNQIKNIL